MFNARPRRINIQEFKCHIQGQSDRILMLVAPDLADAEKLRPKKQRFLQYHDVQADRIMHGTVRGTVQ